MHSKIVRHFLEVLSFLICIVAILSAQEKKESRKLLVGGDHNYPPYEFIDKDNKPTGFCVDLVRAVCAEINLEPEFRFDDWVYIRSLFDDGKLDMLEGMVRSEDRLQKYSFSQPIVPLEFTFFIRKGESKIYSFENLKGKKILVQNQDIMHENLIKMGMHDEAVPVPNPVEALQILSSGRYDAAVTVRLMGNYIIREYGLDNVLPEDTTLFRLDYCFAFHKMDSSRLNLMNHGLQVVKAKGIYNRIYDKWFGIMKPEGFSYNQVFRYALWIGLPVLLILLFIYTWTIILKRQVRQKTMELKIELDERKSIENKLEAEKELLTTTLKSIGEGVVCTDAFGTITLINNAAESMISDIQFVAGTKFDDAFKLRYKSKRYLLLDEMIKNRINISINRELTLLIQDCTEKNISLNGSLVLSGSGEILGTVVILIDLTEKLRIEKELNKTQNLEMVGLLAGGIAHDFNNLLTAILGNFSLAKMLVKKEDKIYERIIRGESAALRAKDLTHQLLSFSKGGAPTKTASDIENTIKDTVDFVLSGSKVKCSYSVESDLWDVEFDEGQISQVISNLIINARQAMPESGLIKISLKNIERLDNNNLTAKFTKYVSIEISDNGKGIEKSELERIFQPYYTTKKTGNGLGLAMVYSIIKNHEGQIEVDSKIGIGSIFRIYLPAKE